MTTYKNSVSIHLRPLIAGGMTQREITTRLGLNKPNFLSMVLNPDAHERLPAKRLPALHALCGFPPDEGLRLVMRHAREYLGGCELDAETVEWIIRCTALALRSRAGAKTLV